MSRLPKIDVPIYTLTLPITKKTYKFRPFLVKEEKLLLMAVETGDENTAIDTIKQIINNCCIEEINVDTLPITDLEFFFLNLRARSVGEEIELEYKCNNNIDNSKCGNIVKLKINILEITPEIPENHSNKIELNKSLGLMMRYPSFQLLKNNTDKTIIEQLMDNIVNCIEYIYDENEIYYSKDIPKEEIVDFIDNLTKAQFDKIQEFFNTIPKIKKDLEFKCKKCGYTENITIEGIQNFLS